MTTEIARAVALRRVGKSLARIQQHHALPITLEDGTSPVVIVLPTDLIGTVQKQIAPFAGANVVVAYEDHMTLIAFQQSPVINGTQETMPVSPDSEIGMLVDLMKTHKEHGVHIKIQDHHVTETASEVAQFDYAF